MLQIGRTGTLAAVRVASARGIAVTARIPARFAAHRALVLRHGALLQRNWGIRTKGDGFSDSFDPEANPLKKKPKGPMYTRDGVPLPLGWEEVRSPSRGIYYAHRASGVTQWDIPRGPPTKEQLAQVREDKHGRQLEALQPGGMVTFRNVVSAPQLNGKRGTCVRWDHASGRVHVRLPTGELKAVKPENLVADAAVVDWREQFRQEQEAAARAAEKARAAAAAAGVQAPSERRPWYERPRQLMLAGAAGLALLYISHYYNREQRLAKQREQREQASLAASAVACEKASPEPSRASTSKPITT